VKEAFKHIVLCCLLALAAWGTWEMSPHSILPDTGPVSEEETACYVLSVPAERPFAIEQDGASLIAPSMSARQWTNPHVQAILNNIARKTFSARKQTIKNCQIFGVSLPPEQIAFPFSSFW